MEDVPILGRDDAMRQEVLAHYGGPAFIRRAHEVEGALQQLLQRCRQQRHEWLDLVRTRLGRLHALAGDWAALRPFLADEKQLACLKELHADLQPHLRLPVEPTTSPRVLRRALQELRESIERFNRRWREHLQGLDLGAINRLRSDYNRYYPLEKECAVRSARVARHGFRPLPPLTHEDLIELLPLLPVARSVV